MNNQKWGISSTGTYHLMYQWGNRYVPECNSEPRALRAFWSLRLVDAPPDVAVVCKKCQKIWELIQAYRANKADSDSAELVTGDNNG